MSGSAADKMASTPTGHMTYRRVEVETASQGKLIVMLFNGAIQRAEEAKRQLSKNRIDGAHNSLVRAQEIVAELRSALNMQGGGDIAKNLNRIYEYFQHLLIKANIQKDTAPIDECVHLMIGMRDTWQELFEQVGRTQPAPHAAAALNPQGSVVLNIEG